VRYPCQPAGLSSARQSEAGAGFRKVSRLYGDHRSARWSIAAFKASEWEMSRQLHARLNRRMVVADSAYGTYVDFEGTSCQGGMPSFVNIMRVTAIFVGGQKLELATISSPGRAPTMFPCSRWLQMAPLTLACPIVHLLIRQLATRPKQIILRRPC